MKLEDFIFNYKSNLFHLLKKRKYFTFIKRIILLPYKFIVSNLRDIFLNKNLDKISFSKKKSLDEQLRYFDSDKSSLCHGYSKFYSSELANLENAKIKILEFGIHYGASQAAMSKYFVNSTVFGIDKNPYFKKFHSKKIHSLYCDVSSRTSLKQLANHLNDKMDIIIDDASHIPDHQLITFLEMFNSLKNGGVYIIEELDVYETYKELYTSNEKNSGRSLIRKFLYDLKNGININIIENSYDPEILKITQYIDWIKIYRGDYIVNNKNISEIAFIKKI